MATANLSLYALEQHLAALLDSDELVAPEQREEYETALLDALQNNLAKRDKVAAFMAHLGSQVTLAKEEEARLKARRERIEKALDKLREYVLTVIRDLGPDDKGKLRRLDGHTASFRAMKCPPSVEISDEGVIPPAYNLVTVTMRPELWMEMREKVSPGRLLVDVFNETEAVSKSELSAALKQGAKVPGARLITDKLRLVVE